MNTTTNTSKNRKKSAEMREENVEAIWTIIFLLKTLPMIHWTPPFLSQWEISISGIGIMRKDFKRNTNDSKKFHFLFEIMKNRDIDFIKTNS